MRRRQAPWVAAPALLVIRLDGYHAAELTRAAHATTSLQNADFDGTGASPPAP